jgi:predicted Zn-dependent protease
MKIPAIIFNVSLNFKRALTLTLTFILTLSCSKVPITNRKQLNMLPEGQLISLSLTSYESFLKKHPAVTAGNDATLVKSVGGKIEKAVTTFMSQQKLSDRLSGYQWEFNLVKDDEANAWCMPGGKVVVYSGLLPLTLDESGLAIVMGHEIAHAVARHGNERMSQALIAQMGGIALSVAMNDQPQMTQDIFLQSYGVSSQLGMLAFSRKHETEADKLGMIFAAMAGYDPQKAIGFWERMAGKGGTKPPEFLSTHPSDATRIQSIKEFMPTAMKYYKQ